MSQTLLGFVLALAAAGCVAVAAEDKRSHFDRGDPALWLDKQVGAWESTSEVLFEADPDGERARSRGDMRTRTLGDNWLISEGVMRFGDASVSFVRTLGFDDERKRYVGTWIDTASNHLWTLEGAMDGDTLVLECSGPSCLEPERVTDYREFYRFTADGVLEHRSVVLHSSGAWVEYMTSEYRLKE